MQVFQNTQKIQKIPQIFKKSALICLKSIIVAEIGYIEEIKGWKSVRRGMEGI